MRIIKTSNFEKEAKKKKKNNPFAICYSKIDKKKNPEKAERCILDIKSQQKDCKDCKAEVNENVIKDAKKKEDEKPYNPYPVCTESVGSTAGTTKRSEWTKEEKERYDRCIEHVKEQNRKEKKDE